MISAQTDQVPQDHLIERYMMLPNQVWDGIINQATLVNLILYSIFFLLPNLKPILFKATLMLLSSMVKGKWWINIFTVSQC